MIPSVDEARRLLGVGPAADAGAIRRAYRRLARERHPDAGGDDAAFQELQSALRVLLATPPQRPPARSPSTSRASRPSTASPRWTTGWGESTTRRWHESGADLTTVDWTRPLPDPPHAWDPGLTAIAAARPLEATVLHPVTGSSRKPGSRLNRFAHWVTSDLMSTFRIAPSPERGVPGHDVEIRLDFPPGKARKLADETSFPLGWTRHRRPDSTTVALVMPPSRDRRETAVRSVSHLQEALDAMGWPLAEWYRLPE